MLLEYWDRGVAKRLLKSTMPIFERWGVRHTGLFTFGQSPKHVALYHKFGYWPRYLTAVMTYTPAGEGVAPVLLSAGKKVHRQAAIETCS